MTASSRGLGFAIASALADEGVNLTICARSEGPLRDAEARLREFGVRVHAVQADVTRDDAPAHLAESTVKVHGGLDILVANAGGPPPGRSLDVSDEQLLDTLNDNLITSVRLVRACTAAMEASGWGRICLITSYSVLDPIPDLALSNTSRSGLLAWAKTAAEDLHPLGITLNIACPGLHATERAASLRMDLDNAGDPADFGRVVAFLCSRQAASISGVAVPVDGGATALA